MAALQKQKQQAAGCTGCSGSKALGEVSCWCPLHLSASSPALSLLRQVLSDHLLIHQPLYLCPPYHTASVVCLSSCEESWKSSWIFYAEHPPPPQPQGPGRGQADGQNNAANTGASKGLSAFSSSSPRKAVPTSAIRKVCFLSQDGSLCLQEKCYVDIFRVFLRKVQLSSE